MNLNQVWGVDNPVVQYLVEARRRGAALIFFFNGSLISLFPGPALIVSICPLIAAAVNPPLNDIIFQNDISL